MGRFGRAALKPIYVARTANRTVQGRGGGHFWSIFDSTCKRPFAIDGLSKTAFLLGGVHVVKK